MSTLLGVDVGGTFTDFLLWDDGAIRVHKRPSTPDDPGRAVLDGLDHLGVTPELIVHGTTVATNAVLQRRGARTALVTTEGFRDLLTIGRQTRPYIYDLEPETPEPLVDPALLFECAGRLRPDGTIEHPWTVEEARALLARVETVGAEAVAVSLLFAYLDPSLEQAFREAGTSLFLSLSSEVSPEYREVERTATTALNSYVGPIMSTYLQRLGDGAPQDELVPHFADRAMDGGADHRLAQAADRTVERRGNAVALVVLQDTARQHQGPGRGIDQGRRGLPQMPPPFRRRDLVLDQRVHRVSVRHP